MSTALAIDPARRPATTFGTVPVLVPAPVGLPRAQPMSRPRVLAAATLMLGACAVVAAQLLLSIGTADGAYRLAQLQHESDGLARQQEARSEVLASLAAPQHLAERAALLGMVPDDAPAYLDARTGAVRGSRDAVTGAATTPVDLTH